MPQLQPGQGNNLEDLFLLKENSQGHDICEEGNDGTDSHREMARYRFSLTLSETHFSHK